MLAVMKWPISAIEWKGLALTNERFAEEKLKQFLGVASSFTCSSNVQMQYI